MHLSKLKKLTEANIEAIKEEFSKEGELSSKNIYATTKYSDDYSEKDEYVLTITSDSEDGKNLDIFFEIEHYSFDIDGEVMLTSKDIKEFYKYAERIIN